MSLIVLIGIISLIAILALLSTQGKLMGYPFWSDSAIPTIPTIYDPILRKAVTSLTFRGVHRSQRLDGISLASGTRTLGNSIRVKVGNELPTYRRITIPANTFQHDLGADQQILAMNYFDLGGIPIIEGDDIELSAQGLEGAAGTGAFAGVLWIEDFEPSRGGYANGNVVCLVHGALAAGGDAGATLTDLSAVLDGRTLSNNRLYTPFAVAVEPEDQAVEACMFYVGSSVLTCPPAGRVNFPTPPLSFSGLEYNSGSVAWFAQCAAAGGILVYMYCIESEIPGGEKSTNVTPIVPISSTKVVGTTNLSEIIALKTGGFKSGSVSTKGIKLFGR